MDPIVVLDNSHADQMGTHNIQIRSNCCQLVRMKIFNNHNFVFQIQINHSYMYGNVIKYIQIADLNLKDESMVLIYTVLTSF